MTSEHFVSEMAAEDLEGGDDEYVRWAGEYKLMQSLEEASSLSELLSELKGKGGQTQASLKLKLTLPGPQQKQEIPKLLDRLPIPVDGQVKATLEVESDENATEKH